MAWTKEQREQASQRAKARHAAKKDAYVAIASTAGMTNEREKDLLDKLKAAEERAAIAEAKLTDAEKMAIELASAAPLMPGDNQEQPTGEYVTVKRLKEYKLVGHKDDGRDILRPVFKDVKLPVFAYRIDMPPVGGTDLKINEVPFYHGATYKLDIDTLRTVKEMVYRLWDHDRNIHGTDENAYRNQAKPRISARGF
jgi:hypothetical protein